MGFDKLSLPWGKRRIFEICLRSLLRSKVNEIIVVIRPQKKKKDYSTGDRPEAISKKVKVVENPSFKKGMSTSIREGLKFVDPKSQGILIALGDQPLLKARTINTLIDAFIPGRRDIVVPFFEGKRGHPVIFDRIYTEALLRLRGDVGGRPILERHRERIIRVTTRSKAVIMDIDTWKDYQKAQR